MPGGQREALQICQALARFAFHQITPGLGRILHIRDSIARDIDQLSQARDAGQHRGGAF